MSRGFFVLIYFVVYLFLAVLGGGDDKHLPTVLKIMKNV